METNNANVAVENKGIDFVAINDDRYKRAEKAYKALDHLQYIIETGQISPDSPITIEAVPHRNGIGTGVKISFSDGDVFLSQEDISGLKMNPNYNSVGRWGVGEINAIPSQAAFGWVPGTALDASGNEIKTFVRKF